MSRNSGAEQEPVTDTEQATDDDSMTTAKASKAAATAATSAATAAAAAVGNPLNGKYTIVGDDDDDDDNEDAGNAGGAARNGDDGERIWQVVAKENATSSSSSSSAALASGAEPSAPGDDSDSHGNEEEEEPVIDETTTGLQRLVVLLSQSFPVIAAFFLQFAGTFVSLLFSSHFTTPEMGSTVFAAVSLANMFTNVTSLSIMVGLSSGVETLASQYNGAKEYKEVGHCVWRCIIILNCVLFPVGVVWLFCKNIFLAIGVDPQVCDVIQGFLRIRAILLPVDVISVSWEKYTMAVGVFAPSFYSSVVFNIVHVGCNAFFILHLKLDYTYLAWSYVIADCVGVAFMLAISWRHPNVQRTLVPFSYANAFSRWWEFLKLGIPATAMLCSEWWAYEVLSLFASILGTDAIAAQAIIFQVTAFLFMIPLGLGITTASIVGNAIGAKKRLLAIQMAHLSLGTICVVEFALAVLVTVKGDLFINVFTPDEMVRGIAKQSLAYMGFFCFFDSIQGTCSGILRGAGKQYIGAITNVVGFYAIGLPCAFALCFQLKMGVNGLLLGMSTAVLFQNVVYLICMFCYQDHIFPEIGFSALADSSEHAGSSVTDTVGDLEDDSDADAVSGIGRVAGGDIEMQKPRVSVDVPAT